MDESASVRFTAVSVYLMITAIFLAGIMSQDAAARPGTLRRGYLFAAWVPIAALLGFDIAGLGEIFTLYGRASGTFKDPNVLGSYLALPIVYVLQRVMTGQIGIMRGLVTLSIPLAAVFSAFSRGAWGVLAVSTALMTALTFPTAPERRRTGANRRDVRRRACGRDRRAAGRAVLRGGSRHLRASRQPGAGL